jgi:glyoxylase I family protein
MIQAQIEHIGFVVTNPCGAADWYAKNLGFTILRKADNNSVAFIQEPGCGLIFELIGNPEIHSIDKDLTHPLQVHIAFKSQNIQADIRRLTNAGASFVMDCKTDDPKAKVCILKDPFGLYIQLARRKDDFYA